MTTEPERDLLNFKEIEADSAFDALNDFQAFWDRQLNEEELKGNPDPRKVETIENYVQQLLKERDDFLKNRLDEQLVAKCRYVYMPLLKALHLQNLHDKK